MDQSEQKQLLTTERKIYTGTAERVLKLLGAGCTQVEAARACGITEGRVSQLMDEPSFREQVNEIVTKTMAEQSKIDKNYNEVERIMSERILKLSDNVWDIDKAVRIAKFANEAKRKVAPSETPSGNGNSAVAHVTLVLPAGIAREFILNPNNEVVGVNGQELTTLPSKKLESLVSEVKSKPKQIGNTKVLKSGPGQIDPYSDL